MTNGKIYDIAELQLLFRRVDSLSPNFEVFSTGTLRARLKLKKRSKNGPNFY